MRIGFGRLRDFAGSGATVFFRREITSSRSWIFGILFFLATVFLGSDLPGQEEGNCRCCVAERAYGPWINELPPILFREGNGNCKLEVSSQSDEARAWFNQGLNHLHGFSEMEAYRCFTKATKIDPECAMAYWGVGMSLPGKIPEAAPERKLAIAVAMRLMPQCEEWERCYILALKGLDTNGTIGGIPHLEKALKLRPDDADAAAFLAYWLRDGYDSEGKPNPGTKRALEIIKTSLKKSPRHIGLHHYLIHILEVGPDFEEARESAELLPMLAPSSGHIVHMPGHIYFLAGEYPEAVQSFLNCADVEARDEELSGVSSAFNPNHFHNLQFLALAAAECGRMDLALRSANSLRVLELREGVDVPAESEAIRRINGTLLPSMTLLRIGDYEGALEQLKPEMLPDGSPQNISSEFLESYLKVKLLLAAEEKNTDLINTHLLDCRRAQENFAQHAPDPAALEAFQWRNQLDAILLLSAELTAATKYEAPEIWQDIALRKQEQAGYHEPPLLPWPLEEEFGRMALNYGEHEKAIGWFQKALIKRRRSAPAHLGLARANSRLGNTGEATKHYREFKRLWKTADPSRPETKEAEEYLQSLTGKSND